MSLVTKYALGRLAFGAAALAAPAPFGRLLAGKGGDATDAQIFLRGIGGREVGLSLGLLRAVRRDEPVLGWLAAGVFFDLGDIAGMTGAWSRMQPDKRLPGIVSAGGAAVAGAVLVAGARR